MNPTTYVPRPARSTQPSMRPPDPDPETGLRSGLYECRVAHDRRSELDNRFRYPLYTWLVDLDEIDELDDRLRLFAHGRSGVTSLHAEDHLGEDPDLGIRANLERWLATRDVQLDGGRVLLLTSPRVLGYVFNPLSVYWCFGPDDDLRCVVAEVHNTYGQRHSYLLFPDRLGRARTDKRFYVSPFFDVDGTYRMHLPVPGERVTATIDLLQDHREVFHASLTGRRRPLTDRALVRLLLRYPLVTLKVTALIRWQGIKLWARGLTVRDRPDHPTQEGDR